MKIDNLKLSDKIEPYILSYSRPPNKIIHYYSNCKEKMRYYSFNEFDSESMCVSTVSEEDIRKEYYPYWQALIVNYHPQS